MVRRFEMEVVTGGKARCLAGTNGVSGGNVNPGDGRRLGSPTSQNKTDSCRQALSGPRRSSASTRLLSSETHRRAATGNTVEPGTT
jgi:hypothetical protein